jgi:leucyl aminopeptidase (aminopeptidase T)
LNKTEKLAKLILLDCLELQPGQSVLLVSEVKQTHAALAFHSVAARAHLELISLALNDRPNGTPRLSVFAKNSLQAADLAIIILPKLEHESLNWLRQQNRTRVMIFSQIEADVVPPSLETDPRQLRDRSRKLADILTIGRALQLTTGNGTALKMSIAQNRGSAEIIPLMPEMFFASLPLGRAFVTPAANSVAGEIILDDLAGSHSSAASPIELKVVEGKITLIKGGKAANELRRRLRLAGANARYIVEIGFGLNDKARLGNSEFEDEKVFGTAHLGIGRLASGSKIPEIFARGILQTPNVMIDGKKIIEEGKILVG